MTTNNQAHKHEKLRKQPNSRHCFICGLENEYGLGMSFYDVGPDEVTATVTIPEHYQGYPGVVHGGITAAMLDEILGRAAMADDYNHFRVTAKMEIHYRRPVPTGEPLTLYGKVIKRRGRYAFAYAELRLPDGSIGAEAEGALADLKDDSLKEEDLEELGWKVYPD
jgi:uncharacterized protein (TIGR00369 family)